MTFGFMSESSPVESVKSSAHDLPSNVQSLLNQDESYCAIALVAYLVSPILLTRLEYQPFFTFDRQDTIERLAHQCFARYNGSRVIDHVPPQLRAALEKVMDVVAQGSGIKCSDPAEAAAMIQRAQERMGVVDKVDARILGKLVK
ncbi:hypothetical protein BCR44DRAFT_1060183 [Catenaria anguillulae PL171]|uniref:Uncharacterized protein n=1 Tax=Catenaria anguillulae PL171 TaxID=765915 RepID=A0A1Y2HQD7_9FUNG|nr:hypothetical protein BCR44DRAFT_1060183 [Catenaria anguillulae PL171]